VRVITVRPGFVQTRMTAGMSLPGPLTATPQQVAKVIFEAYRRNRDNVYILPVWQYIMLVIRHLPEFIFKRLNL
jgi:decaprenylphospho-beta-D-erythro-pentofuranosid-2-ulose 2-reductase